MIGLVSTAYKIDKSFLEHFVINNSGLFENVAGQILIVCCQKLYAAYADKIEAVKCLEMREEMNPFNLARCNNLAIRSAINAGCDIVCKTDIDCILSSSVIDKILTVRPGRGFVFKHWNIKSLSDRRPNIDRKCVGTIALSASDWILCEGYNEELEGYGTDDFQIFQRAKSKGIHVTVEAIPQVLHLEHGEKHNRKSINPVNRRANKKKAFDDYSNPDFGYF